MSVTAIDEFIEQPHGIKDMHAFLLFCKNGATLAKKYPDQKDKIAYRIAEESLARDKSKSDKHRRLITDLAADLELPDHHVYTGDGLSVKQKWELLEELIDEGLKKLDNAHQA